MPRAKTLVQQLRVDHRRSKVLNPEMLQQIFASLPPEKQAEGLSNCGIHVSRDIYDPIPRESESVLDSWAMEKPVFKNPPNPTEPLTQPIEMMVQYENQPYDPYVMGMEGMQQGGGDPYGDSVLDSFQHSQGMGG